MDVTIRGAGIFGLSIAWACARRGARVRVIETSAIGAGSSGGLVGALSPHVPDSWHPKKAFQLESLLMAADWWAAVEAVSGMQTGYARLGRLQPLADAQAVQMAKRRQETSALHWKGVADWRVVAATGVAWEPVSPSGWLVSDTLSARISPRASLAALAHGLLVLGAEIKLGDADEQGRVVHATGVSGLNALSASLGIRIGAGVKGQALSVRYSAEQAPQLFADGLHIVPHADGTVAIGSTSEANWTTEGPDAALDALWDKAQAIVPALNRAEVVERWAGVRPRAATRSPLLGQWPGRQGHFVANGGFKIGFGMAPKVAEVMADLMLEGRDEVPDEFRLEAMLYGQGH